MRNHLVVFTREPKLGRVKRRLARGIGPVKAAAFYRRAVAGLLRRLGRDRRWQCHIAVTPDTAVHAKTWHARLWPGDCRIIAQGPGDLGARMDRVLRNLPAGPAVIVGGDIPGISAVHIVTAFRALGRKGAVFGPAADGGYWLVGMRRRPAMPGPPGIFANVRWSTEHALADTLENLPKNSAAFLETLEDIDDSRALARWQQTAKAKKSHR